MDQVNEEKDLGNAVVDRKTEQGVLRSLDAEIAERVLGWTRYSKTVHPTDNRTINGVLYCQPEYGDRDFGGALNCVPYYSTDLTAAIAVVEKLHDLEFAFSCKRHSRTSRWMVSFSSVAGAAALRAGSTIDRVEPTLPEAICRAALDAIEWLSIWNREAHGQAS